VSVNKSITSEIETADEQTAIAVSIQMIDSCSRRRYR